MSRDHNYARQVDLRNSDASSAFPRPWRFHWGKGDSPIIYDARNRVVAILNTGGYYGKHYSTEEIIANAKLLLGGKENECPYPDCPPYAKVDEVALEFCEKLQMYYRNAGDWYLQFEIKDGQMLALHIESEDGTIWNTDIRGKKIVACTKEEWKEDNGEYINKRPNTFIWNA